MASHWRIDALPAQVECSVKLSLRVPRIPVIQNFLKFFQALNSIESLDSKPGYANKWLVAVLR